MMITDVVGEKRIDLAYPIQSKEVATISMFSDNIQYWSKKPLRVLLPNEEKQLPEGVFTNRKLNLSVGRKVMMALDAEENIIKMNKLAGVMEVVLSLDKLDNTGNLEDRKLSNILLRHHVTGSDESSHTS